MWIARPTQHVVSLRFSHQKGYQHAEQRGLLHDKANVPAGRVHCRCISSDLIWQLPVIYTGICQITSGLNFSRPRCVFHQVTFPLAFAHCTFFPDGFAHYYSEPAIHQDPTVMYQDRRKRYLIKFVQYCFMESLADAVGLQGHRLRFRVFYVVYCQIKLIIMLLYFATVLRASVGQYSQHRQALRRIKR